MKPVISCRLLSSFAAAVLAVAVVLIIPAPHVDHNNICMPVFWGPVLPFVVVLALKERLACNSISKITINTCKYIACNNF